MAIPLFQEGDITNASGQILKGFPSDQTPYGC